MRNRTTGAAGAALFLLTCAAPPQSGPAHHEPVAPLATAPVPSAVEPAAVEPATATDPRNSPAAPAVAATALPKSADIAPAPFAVPGPPQCVDIPVAYKPAKRWVPPAPPPQPPQDEMPQPSVAATGGGGLGMGAAGNMAVESKAVPTEPMAEAARSEAAPMATSAPAPPPAAGPAKKAKAAKTGAPSGAKQEVAAAAPPSKPSPAAGREKRDKKVEREQQAPAVEEFPTEPTTKYLSADDSNSTASPAIVRKLIRARRYVHPDYVRTYEFLNYYSFAYPAPASDEVGIYPEMRPAAQEGELTMQIGVRAFDRARGDMRPLHLVVLLDVSGSMAGEPMALAKSFIHKLAGRLRAGEKLSLVTISRKPTTLLEGHLIGADSPATITGLLAEITPTDITNLEAGLAAAYALAAKGYDAQSSTRVIVVSDGAANAGNTAKALIARHAEDSERQGIYLAGIAVGAGLDDMLMNAVTDKGRGAYAFLDSEQEIDRLLADRQFVSTFDVAVKDVRLKLVLPPGFKVKEFHGEQMSSVASEVVPQYLSPNDQMIYHLVLATNVPAERFKESTFELEAEYKPMGAAAKKVTIKSSASEMLSRQAGLIKGDAVVRYAEVLKRIRYPLEENRDQNTKELDAALAYISEIYDQELPDPELGDVIALLKAYRRTITEGEAAMLACDRLYESPPVVLGLRPEQVHEVVVRGSASKTAVKAIPRLRDSTRLLPVEGYRFLALGSGPIGNAETTNGQLSDRQFADPAPRYMGQKRSGEEAEGPVYDLHQVVLKLKAPPAAKSFSFEFNYFSAEYPEYVQASYNDTFYAILQAGSTNKGKATNISFDPNHSSIEVDNNYFENTFHPIPNTGTGFDHDGSTGWLRTSWPIQGGESFTLTFSIHDEGDGIYDSVVLLDNFQFHDFPAVGNTDPLN